MASSSLPEVRRVMVLPMVAVRSGSFCSMGLAVADIAAAIYVEEWVWFANTW